MIFQQRHDGFTLIELVFVVAIVGVLASIAIPSYKQYAYKAQQSLCLSEVKAYSNNVFSILNSQNNSLLTIAPNISACYFITDATGWTAITQQKIIAITKGPSNARIECDIPNGAPCRTLP